MALTFPCTDISRQHCLMAANTPSWHLAVHAASPQHPPAPGASVRRHTSPRAPVLTLTDCLFLLSIPLPGAPDARMKFLGTWYENSWRPPAARQPKCGTASMCRRSSVTKFTQQTNSAFFFSAFNSYFHSTGAPWCARGQIQSWSVLAPLSRVWDGCESIPKTHIPQLPISATNTSWCIPCQQLPDSCWSEYHQRVARLGIFLISFSVCSAVDTPSLNPSLCSSKNCENMLAPGLSLAHTLARKANSAVFSHWNVIQNLETMPYFPPPKTSTCGFAT